MEKLRELVLQACAASGLSFEEIARSLDCSVDELIAFEKHQAWITAEVLYGLVNILNLTPEQVVPLLDEEYQRQANAAAALDESEESFVRRPRGAKS